MLIAMRMRSAQRTTWAGHLAKSVDAQAVVWGETARFQGFLRAG